ncbi:MAG: hypothetical protein ABIV51_06345 [Saprospiraceae bacterium]
MIQEKTLQIQVDRFGSGLVHLLPLAAIKLKLSLPNVLMLYSASFPLVFAGFFVAITKIFKQWDLGIAVLLLYTLITLDGFYWATSELQQGLGFLLVIVAAILRYPNLNGKLCWTLLTAALISLVFYHPLLILVLAWAIFYLAFRPSAISNKRLFVILGIALVISILKLIFLPNWYDTMKSAETWKHIEAYGSSFWTMPANAIFWKYSWSVLYGFWVVYLVVTIHYCIARKWLLLFWMTACSAGWILLIHFSDPNFTHPFYQEVSYMPLALFVGLPLVKDVLPTWRRKWAYAFITFILLQRLIAIGLHHVEYSDRISWLALQIETTNVQGNSRSWVAASDTPNEELKMTWATAYETLLLSSLNGPENSKTVTILADTTGKQSFLMSDSLLVADFATYPIGSLDSTYFRLSFGATIFLAPSGNGAKVQK